MDLTESFTIDSPMGAVWPLLQDVGVVADCLPGVELKDQEGDSYVGTITVKFGPTTVAFSGRAEITYRPDSESVSINARGTDSRGASRASADVQVRARDAGTGTSIDITGDVDVLGPLAQFARTGGVFVTRQLLKEFAACLGARAAAVTAAVAPSPEPGEAGRGSDASRGGVPSTAFRRPASASVQTATRPVNGFALLWQALVMWVRERFGRRPRS